MNKFLSQVFLSSVTWAGKSFRRVNEVLIPQLETLKNVMAQESEQTLYMLEVYAKQTRGQASDAEVSKANRQFVDLLKAAGIGFYALLPFTLLTIPFFVRLARRFGIEILPSSFQELKQGKEVKSKSK